MLTSLQHPSPLCTWQGLTDPNENYLCHECSEEYGDNPHDDEKEKEYDDNNKNDDDDDEEEDDEEEKKRGGFAVWWL